MISVIIPVFNGALLIERSLRSVLTQDGNYELELLVIDDGSTDNTAEVVAGIGDLRIRFLRQECNQGPAAARNRGLREATGQYVAFLDSDDYWLPGFLSETFQFLMTNPQIIAAFTGQCHKSLKKAESIRPRCAQFDADPQQRIVIDDLYQFWHRQKYAVCTGSVLMRMDIVRKANGQREDFRVGEDLEFWLFLAAFGSWGFIPKILFVSDGMRVTAQQGWVEKNQKRWRAAPSMEDWESRILNALSEGQRESYCHMRGEIAMMLQYCMIASGRDSLAWDTWKKYHHYYPIQTLTKLYRAFACSWVLWKLLCLALRYREHHRKI